MGKNISYIEPFENEINQILKKYILATIFFRNKKIAIYLKKKYQVCDTDEHMAVYLLLAPGWKPKGPIESVPCVRITYITAYLKNRSKEFS